MGVGKKRRAPRPVEHDDREHDSSSDGEEELPGGGGAAMRKRHRADRAARGGGLVSTFFQANNVAGSSRTLADLQLDGAAGSGAAGEEVKPEEGLRQLLQALPERHAAEKAELRRRLHSQFGRWWAQLRAGNSLLLYGFGSKYELLSRFAREQTQDGASLAVNGLHPGLTAKQIMMWATAALKGTKAADYRGCSKDDMLDLLGSDTRRLYLMLHNIDGPGLRDHAAQRMLSELAALPNVHLAASMDHVNAALLWDLQTRDRFSWVWHNATCYTPYFREVGFAAIPSMLMGRGEQCSKQSATVVLASLSHSAREVFKLIAGAQLDPLGEQGITFQHLFQCCRERFLVSNESLLKSFLTEFRDHELVQTKRDGDGSDLLHVPLPEEVLQQVLQDIDAF